MRAFKHSVGLVTLSAMLLGGALGLTTGSIDWPATTSVQAAGDIPSTGQIDWP